MLGILFVAIVIIVFWMNYKRIENAVKRLLGIEE